MNLDLLCFSFCNMTDQLIMFKNLFKSKPQLRIEYIPDVGCKVNLMPINWGDSRSAIRDQMNYRFKEDNRIIELTDDEDIELRRDIYQSESGNKYHFILSYDEKGKLSEISIHSGAIVIVKGIELQFGKDIDIICTHLNQVGENFIGIEEGNFLFEDLKLTIANSQSMGGEGNGLDYFYASKDISHLTEN